MPKQIIVDPKLKKDYQVILKAHDWSTMNWEDEKMRDAASDIYNLGYGNHLTNYLLANKCLQAYEIVSAMYDEFDFDY